jgi:hypothetical protein
MKMQRKTATIAILFSLGALLTLQMIPISGATSIVVINSPSYSAAVPFASCGIVSETILRDGSTVLVARLQSSSSKIGSVTLVISPLTLNNGRYRNTQTTTVKSTTGTLMNGVAVVMYENAGKSGGYFHSVTGPTKYPNGEAIEHDTYPGPGSYTEWSSASWNGQTVLSLKITVIVP